MKKRGKKGKKRRSPSLNRSSRKGGKKGKGRRKEGSGPRVFISLISRRKKKGGEETASFPRRETGLSQKKK